MRHGVIRLRNLPVVVNELTLQRALEFYKRRSGRFWVFSKLG